MADSPLQKAPYGLLGAFDLKTMGQNPPRFGGVVVPSVEVIDFYLADALQTEGNTETAGVGQTAISSYVEVPAGEVWRVHGVSGDAALQAADTALTCKGVYSIVPPAHAGVIYIAATDMLKDNLTAHAFWLPVQSDVFPLILTPGWRLTMTGYLSGANAATWNLRSAVLYQPFPS